MDTRLAPLAHVLDEKGLVTDPFAAEPYCRDILKLYECRPLAVLRPRSTAEVAAAVRWAAAAGVAIVPQGGNSGLCGGASAAGAGDAVILSLERMRAVRSVDPVGNTMVVEAGVVLADAQAAAEAAGRRFALTHGGAGQSRIGGNLSTNAGGNNALRFGTARDQVLGIEAVLADGRVWDGLRLLRKNTAGYDLKQLFIGAEGTLGIITAAALRLRPLARSRATAVVALATPDAALGLLRRLEDGLGEVVEAFELISAAALDKALTIDGIRPPFAAAHPWLVLVEVATASPLLPIEAAFEDVLVAVAQDGLLADAVVARSGAERDGFWKLREAIALACIEDPSCLRMDTAVPVAAVPDFIAGAEAAVAAVAPGARPLPYGHAGDGNIHFNICRGEGMAHEAFRARWDEVEHAVFEVTLALGGTISAEHGIGRLKAGEFARTAPPLDLELMRVLKRALDPSAHLNPGAIFEP
ncbi:FAD-binding oxidoreductase [Arenibaculum sp.]|jgi:FAD/FMN-containing dehydrogenase|uniref:FAD-binding oxidoreductase n=1 Tax=Arenibaculum sp. TaxID=2865862 RepID=UPI002E15F33C|nr:FAD-binding oxidoreductase [Arenibaculum sp.]